MRRMAVHDSDAVLDQLMSKADLLVADMVIHVSAPMDRRHYHIALPIESEHLAGDAARGFLRNVLEKVDAGPLSGRGPFPRNAARRRAIRKDEQGAFSRYTKNGRSRSLPGVVPRAPWA